MANWLTADGSVTDLSSDWSGSGLQRSVPVQCSTKTGEFSNSEVTCRSVGYLHRRVSHIDVLSF